MLSRALSLATVTLLIGCLAAIPVRAQNLEAGKSPSQIFAGTCTACHKAPRGLLKTVPAGVAAGLSAPALYDLQRDGLASQRLSDFQRRDRSPCRLQAHAAAARLRNPPANPGRPPNPLRMSRRRLRPPSLPTTANRPPGRSWASGANQPAKSRPRSIRPRTSRQKTSLQRAKRQRTTPPRAKPPRKPPGKRPPNRPARGSLRQANPTRPNPTRPSLIPPSQSRLGSRRHDAGAAPDPVPPVTPAPAVSAAASSTAGQDALPAAVPKAVTAAAPALPPVPPAGPPAPPISQ